MKEQIARFGSKFVVEPAQTQLTGEEMHLLERLQPAGIMFRKRNFLQGVDYELWLTAYEKLILQLRQVIHRQNIMLCLDHEGGRVIRPPAPITAFPYAARWADSAEAVGQAMAVELKSLGINVNFAPVADIHSNPNNPVINERAFGRNAQEVSSTVVQFAKTLSNNGILPCAKHFPGHGDTDNDSHYELPVLHLSMEELRKRELIPFQSLIDWGVPIIMTAHVLFPKIDPLDNATFSAKILHDLLRVEMGYKGIVISDGLGMAPAVGSLSKRETLAKAVNAGLDLFLVTGDTVTIADAAELAQHLETALIKGEIREESLEASIERIEKLLSVIPQYPISKLDNDTIQRHHALAERLKAKEPWSNFELVVPGFD